MDLRRLGKGEWIAGTAGVALLISLFLPWYERNDGCFGLSPCHGTELSAWEALAVDDVLLALVAAFAVVVVIVTVTQRVPALPLALDGLLTIAALIAVILVLVRVLALPGDAVGRVWGLWLAMAAALGIVAGAWLAMRDERLSRPGRTTDAAGRPVPPPPPLETIPAPPAAGG